MKNKIILVLMQLKGVSRKTILKFSNLTPGMECTVESVEVTINRASMENVKISKFSKTQIEDAVEKADKIIENCKKNDIRILTFLDDEYPYKLQRIPDKPVILYYKGSVDYLNEMCSVAIIGTREPTEYGLKIARKLGSSFGKKGYVVVSGLAIGCDSGGHEGCLDVSGKTVAVMAGGLDKIYPAENKKLAQRILDNGGGLISEYPPYAPMFKGNFVDRDRIQSGLSDGVFVVETAEKGGTLHTVQYAINYNRILACFNHPLDHRPKNDKADGNQKLIREGKAMPISDDDELNDFISKMEKWNKEVKGKENEGDGIQMTIDDYNWGGC